MNNFFLLDGKGNISKTLNCEDIFSKNISHKESKPLPLESFKTKGKKPESLDKKIKKILKKIEIKEQYISNLSIQLEQKNNYNNFDYQNNEAITHEIKLAQDELSSLENEWQNLEEEKLTRDL